MRIRHWRRLARAQYQQLLVHLSPHLARRKQFGKYQELSWRNVWQRGLEPELLIVSDLLAADKIFLDVGANRGLYTYMARRELSPDKIIAFEPHPRLARNLRILFPEVQVISAALSDRGGSASFKVPISSGFEVHTRGTLNTAFQEADETDQRTLTVDTVSLDQFVAEAALGPIGLIKIDVEGHEFTVLRGAEETLRRQHPFLMVEIEQRHHAAQNVNEIIDFVLQLGYEGYYLDVPTRQLRALPRGNDLNSLQRSEPGAPAYVNNVFFAAEGIDMQRIQNNIASDRISFDHEEKAV